MTTDEVKKARYEWRVKRMEHERIITKWLIALAIGLAFIGGMFMLVGHCGC